MNGNAQRRPPGWLLWLLAASATGCGNRHSEVPAATRPTLQETVAAFDARTAGTISGRVTWEGDIPNVPPFEVWSHAWAGDTVRTPLTPKNPNAPAIDARSRGVAGAVVFLRGVEPRKARPWDHAAVHIVQQDLWLHVRQGQVDSSIGFVRRGSPIDMVSEDDTCHSLHGGGASFFTLQFPEPHQPLSRSLHDVGVVELSSTTGYYWMRAYLFVDDHPYYTRTDTEGRFALRQVPPGHYEVVCWLPNWAEAEHFRDPETGLMARLSFGPPAECAQHLTLGSQEFRQVDFVLSLRAFQRQAAGGDTRPLTP